MKTDPVDTAKGPLFAPTRQHIDACIIGPMFMPDNSNTGLKEQDRGFRIGEGPC